MMRIMMEEWTPSSSKILSTTCSTQILIWWLSLFIKNLKLLQDLRLLSQKDKQMSQSTTILSCSCRIKPIHGFLKSQRNLRSMFQRSVRTCTQIQTRWRTWLCLSSISLRTEIITTNLETCTSFSQDWKYLAMSWKHFSCFKPTHKIKCRKMTRTTR